MTTVLLVDDDPLHAHVRRSILGRHFSHVERASDAVEAFILVEDPRFAEKLGLVVVGLHRPGLGSPAFVTELTSRLPSIPVLVLGRGWEEATFFSGPNVHFLPRSASPGQIVAVIRQMMEPPAVRVA